MIDPACERFEHTIVVKVTTQFPHISIDQTIKQLLGPWCASAKLVETKDKLEMISEGRN